MSTPISTPDTSLTNTDGQMPLGFVATFASLTLVVVCLSLIACYTSRRKWREEAEAAKRATKAPTGTREELLLRLASVSPKQTLGEWWPSAREKLHVSEEVDSQFVCSICLDQINPTDTIHVLACNHAFHDQCLERWFLGSHLTCPLCQRQFYPGQQTEGNVNPGDAV